MKADLKKEGDFVRVRISGQLREQDVDAVASRAEKILKQQEHPDRILVDADDFHGWADFPAFVRHMEFIRDHHQYIKKVAVKGLGPWREILPQIASMIPDVELKIFDPDKAGTAEAWLES